MPHPSGNIDLRHVAATALIWSMLQVCAHASPGFDQQTLSFEQAMRLAEQHAPELQASAHTVNAARLAIQASGQLPNPKLFAGVENLPVTGNEAGRFTKDPMTMQKVGIMQDIPNAAKRKADVAMQQANLAIATSSQAHVWHQLHIDTAMAWVDCYFLQRRLALFNQMDAQNKALGNAVQGEIAAGQAMLPDHVLARQAAIQLADQRDDTQRDLIKASAVLQRFTQTDLTDKPLMVGGQLPDWHIDANRLQRQLQQSPYIQMLAAQGQLADAQIAAAQAKNKPDIGVEVAWQHRAPAYGDMLALQASVELPVFSSRRVVPQIQSAELNRLAVADQQAAQLREQQANLQGQLALYQTLQAQANRARQQSVPLAATKATLALNSFKAGKGSLSAVMMARKEAIEAQLRALELEHQQAVTAANLYYSFDRVAAPAN